MPRFRFLGEWVVERGAGFWGVRFFGGVVANVGSEREAPPISCRCVMASG